MLSIETLRDFGFISDLWYVVCYLAMMESDSINTEWAALPCVPQIPHYSYEYINF
jgi:hypothetical protein